MYYETVTNSLVETINVTVYVDWLGDHIVSVVTGIGNNNDLLPYQ